MFTLRIYTEAERVETNLFLGETYNLVRKDENPEDFKKCLEVLPNADESTYAFITYRGGEMIRPLYKNQPAYVMTDSGRTFANVSFR